MANKNSIVKIFFSIIVIILFSFFPVHSDFSKNNYKNKMGNINSISYPKVFNLSLSDKQWIEEKLSSLTLREKCAQMVMPWVLGEYVPDDSIEFARITRLVKDDKVGGLIFFKGNILNEAMLINKMQKLSDIPLLIASDFERGLAMRLTDAIEFPYNMAVAATGNPQYAYLMGKDIAVECKAIGVNQNYAPVADINNNPENPIINIRSYSEDKNIVSEFCDAFIKGAEEENILTTAKHFPGHGDTKTDSHQELPLIEGDSAELTDNELYPFKNSIQSGVHCIMIGHLNVPAFDTTKNLPATLSKPIITGLLQNKMGFDGLIATDAMNMNAVTKYYSVGEAAVKAVEAGNDLILMPPDEEIAINAIYNAVKSGAISEDRINYSVRKILAAKKWLKLNERHPTDLDGITKIINRKSHLRLAEEIAEKSITLVKNDKKIIPVDASKIHRAACITITDGIESESDLLFQKLAEDNFDYVNKIILNKKSRPKDYIRAYQIAKQSNFILLPSFVKVRAYQGTVKLSKRNTDFINKVIRLKSPTILISFGNPYLLTLFPKAKTYLCAYGDPPVSQQAMMKAILGEINITGKLPISIPNSNYKIGDGVQIEKKTLEFSKVEEDTNYNFSKVDKLMTNGVNEKIFPGAVLLIGSKGKIIYNKPFGRFTFNQSSPQMTRDGIFDLSSVTQTIAATTAAMMLFDKAKLDLDEKVYHYFPKFKTNGKENITIQNLLLFNSGLNPKEDLTLNCSNGKQLIDSIMILKLDYPTGSKTVFCDVNMIILQKVIEKISGKPLDKFLKEKLFKPLKMTRTMFNPPDELKYYCPPTKNSKGIYQGVVENDAARLLGGVAGNSGLFSDAENLAVFVQMIIQNGVYGSEKIIKPSTVKKWITLPSNINLPSFGWENYSPGISGVGNFSSQNSFGCSNKNGISIMIDKDKELFIILLSNSSYAASKGMELQKLRANLNDTIISSISN